MLRRPMIQEIIDMKLKGYSLNEVISHYESKPGKVPSRPTIRKYYNMDVMPKGFEESQSEHSNHRYLIDPWPIGNTVCRQTAFDRHYLRLRLLSAVVMGLRTKAITANARASRVGVSGRYPFIPPIKLPVLRPMENR